MRSTWRNTAVRFVVLIPQKFRTLIGAFCVVVVFIIGGFVTPESADNTRANRAVSLFGLAVIIFVMWATSRDRKAIVWHTVIVGMFLQFITALFVLRSSVGYDIFNFVSELARDLLGFADQGTIFLTDATVPTLGWFLTGVLPAIVFFVALVQLLYYNGVLQWYKISSSFDTLPLIPPGLLASLQFSSSGVCVSPAQKQS